jgi:hypothetical protein
MTAAIPTINMSSIRLSTLFAFLVRNDMLEKMFVEDCEFFFAAIFESSNLLRCCWVSLFDEMLAACECSSGLFLA